MKFVGKVTFVSYEISQKSGNKYPIDCSCLLLRADSLDLTNFETKVFSIYSHPKIPSFNVLEEIQT